MGIRFPVEATHFLRPEGPDQLSEHPASYIMNINGSFPSCKAAGRDAKHSPLFSKEVVNRPTRGHSVLSPYTSVAVICEAYDKFYSLKTRRKVPPSSFHFVMDKVIAFIETKLFNFFTVLAFAVNTGKNTEHS